MASIELDKNRKKALGRGLASLIPGASEEGLVPLVNKKEFFECEIDKIVPNTFQPRKIFDQEKLDELVESVKALGIIEPIVVRQRDGHYEIMAGERRWRAALKAGLETVPVIVKDVDGDSPSLEIALVENIQREDLNCIEEAIAYQQLMDEFQMSQEEIAQRVGKNRATVANTLRLLKLPAVIREDITSGALTMGHARALLALESTEDQLRIRELVIKKKLSVRETERRVNECLKAGSLEQGSEDDIATVDPNLIALEDDLRRMYGVGVKIIGNENRGMVQFQYSTREDLMQLADKLKGNHVSTADGSI